MVVLILKTWRTFDKHSAIDSNLLKYVFKKLLFIIFLKLFFFFFIFSLKSFNTRQIFDDVFCFVLFETFLFLFFFRYFCR